MWHVTHDTRGWWTLSINIMSLTPNGFWLIMFWRFGGKGWISVPINILMTMTWQHLFVKSYTRETPNLLINDKRSTHTEKILVFSFSLGIWLSGGGLHFFPMQCTLLKSFKTIYTFNAQQFNSYDCIELHCIANRDLQCTAMYWTALHPLLCTTLHCTG